MDDISEFLLGPQRGGSSAFGLVLTVIAVALASALMLYLARCYIQERRIRKRIARRVHQPYGGNIVPPEVISCAARLSETKRLPKKSSRILPLPQCDSAVTKVRRRSHSPHPWKLAHLRSDAATPH